MLISSLASSEESIRPLSTFTSPAEVEVQESLSKSQILTDFFFFNLIFIFYWDIVDLLPGFLIHGHGFKI